MLPAIRATNQQGLEQTFATHVAGPHLLTERLVPHLRRGARIIFVTSGGMYLARLSVHDLDWRVREYDGVAAYAQTKRMQTVLAEVWAQALAEAGISVYAMHPGWADTPALRTSIPRFHRLMRGVLRSPEQGADTIVWLAARHVPPQPTGGLFFDRSQVRSHYLPWTKEPPEVRAALMDQLAALSHQAG